MRSWLLKSTDTNAMRAAAPQAVQHRHPYPMVPPETQCPRWSNP